MVPSLYQYNLPILVSWVSELALCKLEKTLFIHIRLRNIIKAKDFFKATGKKNQLMNEYTIKIRNPLTAWSTNRSGAWIPD